MMAVLLLGFVGRITLSPSISPLVPSILFKLWAIYLCLWIRKIRPGATSLFWVCGSLFCDAVIILAAQVEEQTPVVAIGAFLWSLLAIASGTGAIYVIRHELLKHYNEVEPRGLFLGGITTFFFSYLYFQYQLRDIVDAKRQEADSLTS